MRKAAGCLWLACAVGAGAAPPPPPGPMQSNMPPDRPTASGDRAPAAAALPGAQADQAAAPFDVRQLFATTCGWCHSKGGRVPGKGPQLMGTQLSDREIASRIRNGKPGRMPAFGTTFSDGQIAQIIAYIRGLEPE
jgi:mono/diheme cytochrome c family protein